MKVVPVAGGVIFHTLGIPQQAATPPVRAAVFIQNLQSFKPYSM
jgi:hypothetical protein